jgi:hypothetical protein
MVNLLVNPFPDYPNPSNPSTTIAFALSVRCDLHLDLVNVPGQVVKEIASGTYEAGIQRALDGSVPGRRVCLYRWQAGGYRSVRRAVLMK